MAKVTIASSTYTKGDDTALLLTATLDGTAAIDITGSSLETVFPIDASGTELTIPDATHEITDGPAGEYKINWTTTETNQLLVGDEITFKTQITLVSGKKQTVWFINALRIRAVILKDQ